LDGDLVIGIRVDLPEASTEIFKKLLPARERMRGVDGLADKLFGVALLLARLARHLVFSFLDAGLELLLVLDGVRKAVRKARSRASGQAHGRGLASRLS